MPDTIGFDPAALVAEAIVASNGPGHCCDPIAHIVETLCADWLYDEFYSREESDCFSVVRFTWSADTLPDFERAVLAYIDPDNEGVQTADLPVGIVYCHSYYGFASTKMYWTSAGLDKTIGELEEWEAEGCEDEDEEEPTIPIPTAAPASSDVW